ncbi:MAG: sulfur carrier protein ThiS adenylyltransferase ThiF [Methanobrevibacter sp.]|jgi:sulfur carrier protein ThiS adenylyltransferase|nr:sulfur carrier protein ThiS adenylyltransferase ThiF [Methanobrevibacter sp.]
MIEILFNGNKVKTKSKNLLDFREDFVKKNKDLKSKNFKGDYVLILNGFQVEDNVETKDLILTNGDTVNFIKKGEMPKKEEFESMISARHSPGVYEKLKKSKVAIAGLGGLGSNISIILSRIGVGKLLLVDFDIVEPSNLNRQQYLIKDLGTYKTDALKDTISQINPFIEVITKTTKVNEDNVKELFEDYDIVCEAFDKADQKSMLINSLLNELPNIKIVSGSGMAGYESSNLIKTTQLMKNLYLCGDYESEAKFFNGLMAPRVTVCAAHQANMVLRLLLNIKEP